MRTLKYIKSNFNLLTFSVILFSMAFALANCVDATDTDPTPDDEDNPTVTGFATDKIAHTHVKGTDPCPQDVFYRIEVFCFEAQEFNGTCDADSVAIIDKTPDNAAGLTAFFSNNQKSSLLNGDGTPIYVNLKFTCQIAVSFNHTYTLILYKDGVEVKREDVVVNVTVS
jgi:hypothetical protein